MPNFLIIGGGIGGLAAAASLHARGLSATVFERAPQLREVGAAVALWPNAMLVLKYLGVMDALIRRSHIAPTGAMRTQSGRILVAMSAMQTEVPTIFAHRAHVHEALLSAVPPDWVFLNKRCVNIENEEGTTGRVRACFDDGTASEWADALIGADGIHSVVRQLTIKDGPAAYQGYIAWRGVADFPSTDTIVGETWGRGQRFGFIPLGGTRVGWWATANKTEAQAAETCRQTPAQWKQEVLQRFANWHGPIPALLAATPESAFLCNEIRDRDPLEKPATWGNGRITLLGDAAHPITPNLGQGACMAIEDGAVLAHAAASIPEAATALRVYEHTRRTRTAKIVRDSRELGRIGQWQNPVACTLRNMLVRLAPEKRMRRQFRDLWFYNAWETPLIMQG